jgi:hypothetical protein
MVGVELYARYILMASFAIGCGVFLSLLLVEICVTYYKSKKQKRILSDAWERWAKK